MEFVVPGGMGSCCQGDGFVGWILEGGLPGGWAESVREVQGVDGILDMEFLVPRGMGSCCQGVSHPGGDNFGMQSSLLGAFGSVRICSASPS